MTIRHTLVFAALAAAAIAAAQGNKGPAVQMPGDNGKVGVPYSLGAKGDELVFTLDKAEFASRVLLADGAIYAEPGERLLVVTYSVQNPAKVDRFFFKQSFTFTVVSPEDKNFVAGGAENNGTAAYHPGRREPMSMQLKPAQKVQAIAVVEIHPTGPVNKLIMQRGKGTPVLRYDLKEKVKPMSSAFAAANGMDILDIGKAKAATPFDLGPFDLNIEKVEESTTEVGGFTPDAGNKLIILTVSAKNAGFAPTPLNGSLLLAKLLDENGEEMQHVATAKMSSTDGPNQQLDAGQQVRFRYVFQGAAAVKLVSLKITEYSTGRSVTVALN